MRTLDLPQTDEQREAVSARAKIEALQRWSKGQKRRQRCLGRETEEEKEEEGVGGGAIRQE